MDRHALFSVSIDGRSLAAVVGDPRRDGFASRDDRVLLGDEPGVRPKDVMTLRPEDWRRW